MKETIFKILFVAAFTMAAGYSVYSSQQDAEMSDMALANMEALADGELVQGENQCYQVFTSADWFHKDQVFVDCYTCTQKKERNFDISRRCYRH